jgi:hypothetical protein
MTGFIDVITDVKVKGWAFDGNIPVIVEILMEGELIGSVLANDFREDLMHAGYGDGCHGFEFVIPSNMRAKGSVTARIFGGVALIDNTKEQIFRWREKFISVPVRGFPSMPWTMTEKSVSSEDIKVAQEVIVIWGELREGFLELEGKGFLELEGIWDIHTRNKQQELVTLLETKDAAVVAAFFVELPRQDVTDGIFQGKANYDDLITMSDEGRNLIACTIFDALVGLSQYLGNSVECPEQGEYGAALHQNPNLLRSYVEDILNVGSIVPPLIFDGLLSIFGGLSTRDVHGLYAALRVTSIKKGHICEIGGGIGRAAYYATKLGAEWYTIVDLPIICLLQYFSLRRSLPDTRVTVNGDGKINIMPAWSFPTNYDIVLNCDSFPEMGDKILKSYANNINSPILSINQEAAAPLTSDIYGPRQVIVGRVLENNFKLNYRFPCWVRKGYVEELWLPI